ncbi:MAG: OmpA family protein [Acidobacteriales bacterium]|nr:OmpA family protein [Terriglobales bacterium]
MAIRKTSMLALLLLLVGLTVGAMAQDKPLSKVDVFTGYAWHNPGGSVNGIDIPSIPAGIGTSSTWYLSKNWGLTFDSGVHWRERTRIYTAQFGPTYRFGNYNGIIPFVHVLGGLHYQSISGLDGSSAFGFTGGGGLDMVTKWDRINLRLIEADYLWADHHYTGASATANSGPRIRTGIVWNFGTFEPPVQPSASCNAQPSEVFEGEPVALTASGSNFNPKHDLAYTWDGQGVKINGSGANVNVDTKGMAPGSYPVKVMVRDTKSSKAFAGCTASFSVKAPRPPQVSCSASPNVVMTGDSSTIRANGSSPDGRPLSYSYRASAGTISGSGAGATLSTRGVQPGRVNVDCMVSDDRNLTASDSTSVTVQNPPPPPPPPAKPKASLFNTIKFKKNSARVDNQAKAILDDMALRMQRDADARASIVGKSVKGESKTLAGQRAVNAKAYLTKEKGIDPARIDVRSAQEGGDTTADLWHVPAGATADTTGTDPVKEMKSKMKSKK